ncbi:endonuclease/exonuclease/phosphatase family protein [Fulvivirgaceae bacterium BMA12]|uniref:Endonuclease/exonuclease/phosphatase family protein n=1 Tax=Agaribacillus aureus TaxID=3051825 RepID=A0ABT8LDH3_9BACT|nr:endonuclease/exonuclease/phosphatase family protein [Fulvivirgaceae bacterium BMA12]
MPFYVSLKIKDTDNAVLRLKKQRVSANLLKLRSALINHFSASGSETDVRKSVRVATWNLREFGGSKFEGRDFESIYYIAEIISHFDLVALQEVRADLTEFLNLKRILGPDWDYVATDVTDGRAGNGERMIFLYNQRYVRFTNIAGELTLQEGGKIRAAFGERINLQNNISIRIPDDAPNLSGVYDARLKSVRGGGKKLASDLEIELPEHTTLDLPEGSSVVLKKNTVVTSPGRGKASVDISRVIFGDEYALRFPQDTFDDSLRQFARTPYLLSFQSGWLKLNLCTVHIYYGDASDENKLEQRRSEIEQLTAALAKKAKGEFSMDDNSFLGVLGDFNIVGEGHPTMEALESSGFVIPKELKSIPGSNVARDKAYDQIAFWKPPRQTGYAKLDVLAANIFDFFEHIFTLSDEATYRSEVGNGLKSQTSYKTWRTYKMSDHLPMWIELRTDFGREYLEAMESGA